MPMEGAEPDRLHGVDYMARCCPPFPARVPSQTARVWFAFGLVTHENGVEHTHEVPHAHMHTHTVLAAKRKAHRHATRVRRPR